MQRTRLSTLVSTFFDQLERWLVNPWRRISIVIISLLFGYFFGVAIAAYAGQAAEQDIVFSAILVILAEIISRITYFRRQPQQKALWLEALNSFKIGALYALILEAFKLGS